VSNFTLPSSRSNARQADDIRALTCSMFSAMLAIRAGA
jgi:hypothetical protein